MLDTTNTPRARQRGGLEIGLPLGLRLLLWLGLLGAGVGDAELEEHRGDEIHEL